MIEDLANKAKFPGFLHIDEAVFMIAAEMFGDEWEQCPCIDTLPFDVKKIRSIGSRVHRQLVWRCVVDGKFEKEKSRSVPPVAKGKFIAEKRASKLYHKASKLLRDEILSNHISLKIIMPKDGKTLTFSEVPEGVWLKRYRTIFQSGYVPISRNKKITYGRLLISKNSLQKLISRTPWLVAKSIKRASRSVPRARYNALVSAGIYLCDEASKEGASLSKDDLQGWTRTKLKALELTLPSSTFQREIWSAVRSTGKKGPGRRSSEHKERANTLLKRFVLNEKFECIERE